MIASIVLVVGGLVAAGVLLILWVMGALSLGLIRWLFGFGGHGAGFLRIVLWAVLLFFAGSLIASRWDGAPAGREAGSSADLLPGGDPLRRSCAESASAAERQRREMESYRRRLSKTLAETEDPAERTRLEDTLAAIEDWMEWLDASGEVSRAVAAGLDASAARQALRRSGRAEYLRAASRADLEWEKARRRAGFAVNRLASRWRAAEAGNDAGAE